MKSIVGSKSWMSAVVLAVFSAASFAGELSLGEGKLLMTAPETWVAKEPRSRIVEVEYEVPGTEEGAGVGRLTIMPAGGSVEQNIARWEGQFAAGAEDAKIEKFEVGAIAVHVVDIAGTFKDSPGGPMGPVVERENYRMLGAILQAPGAPAYYVKLTGPNTTLAQNEEAFKAFVRSVSMPEK